jgi:probable rRNA maturation factor
LSVAIVDGLTMRRLNATHLDHDFDTDVLSFLFEVQQRQPATGDALRGAGKAIEGEVIVSADMAVRQAHEFDWSPQDELVLYLVHGLLHLVGYDDLSPDEKRVMRSRERDILSLWQLVPRYAGNDLAGDRPAVGDSKRGRDSD